MLGAATDKLPKIAIVPSNQSIALRAKDEPGVIELIRRRTPESRAPQPSRPLLFFRSGGQGEENIDRFPVEPTAQYFCRFGCNALPISPLHTRIAKVAEQEGDRLLLHLFGGRGACPRQ